MSSDADAHKVGLIPVTLMVSGNIMGSGDTIVSFHNVSKSLTNPHQT